MKTPTTRATKKIYFGKRKADKRMIWLSPPSWDCQWYWGYGYLGNNDEHWHVSSIFEKNEPWEWMNEAFDLAKPLQDESARFKFLELMQTFYTLRKAADTFNRGGSHYSKNPVEGILKNNEFYEHINSVMLPAIFEAVENLFES